MIELEIGSMAAPVFDLLSQNRHGVVLGSTGRAAYLRFGRSVVTVAPVGSPRMPNEITIRGPLIEGSFQSGMIVDVAPGKLHSPGWRITWSRASVPAWSPEVPAGKRAPEDVVRRGAWILGKCGVDYKLASQHPADCIFAVDPSIGAFKRSREAIARCLAVIRSPVRNLPLSDVIGCGHGLTPSGDDFTCALILARRAWAMDQHPPSLAPKEINSRTSALSATLLTLASEGMTLEPLSALLDINATEEGLQASLEQLLMIGQSTGRMYATTIGLVGLSMSKHYEHVEA